MVFSLLATRALSRTFIASSTLTLRCAPKYQITRNFSVSSVAWARAATTKPSAEKTPAKKRVTSKSTKKPAAKKTAVKKTAARKSKTKKVVRKPKKKAVKKKATIRVKPEHRPPKSPITSFFSFFRNVLKGAQRHEGETALEMTQRVAKEAGVSWKALSEQEKQGFRDEYAAARLEYKKQLEEYVKNTDHAIIREINKRRAKKGKSRIPVSLRPPSLSGYIVFCMEQRVNLPVSNAAESREVTKEVARRWNALSDEEKAPYNSKARATNESRAI